VKQSATKEERVSFPTCGRQARDAVKPSLPLNSQNPKPIDSSLRLCLLTPVCFFFLLFLDLPSGRQVKRTNLPAGRQEINPWIFSGQYNSRILKESNSLACLLQAGSNNLSFHGFFKCMTLASKPYGGLYLLFRSCLLVLVSFLFPLVFVS